MCDQDSLVELVLGTTVGPMAAAETRLVELLANSRRSSQAKTKKARGTAARKQ